MGENRRVSSTEGLEIIHVETLPSWRWIRILTPSMWAAPSDFLPKGAEQKERVRKSDISVGNPDPRQVTKVHINSDVRL